MSRSEIAVALERGARRVFAVALDWPGWARAGRTDEEALERLAAYAPRYAAAVDESALQGRLGFEVVERLEGGSGTDFGVPSAGAEADERPLTPAGLERERRLLMAAWAAFDRSAATAAGRQLRLGPRGGGRDVPKMTSHVLEAEEAYLHQLGSRRPRPAADGLPTRLQQVRDAALVALATRARGDEPPDPNQVRSRWSPRYFVRRSAWHALDHAWEIEDRLVE